MSCLLRPLSREEYRKTGSQTRGPRNLYLSDAQYEVESVLLRCAMSRDEIARQSNTIEFCSI